MVCPKQPSSRVPYAPPAARRGRKLVWIVVCLGCVAAGAAVPVFVPVPQLFGKTKAEAKGKGHGTEKTATVPFGDAVVNLSEERMTRYLRVKVVLVVDADQEKDATAHVGKHKAALKNWLIGHLAGKSLKDVAGTVGVKRVQREILERFEDELYPDGHGPLRDVLFEEFVVQ